MKSKTNSTNMWLVYMDEEDNYHYQPWTDLVNFGTLIDPDSGNDMDMIGWTTELPK